MKVKVLGTRGEVEPTAPYHARHSGILVDDALLFDLGEREYLEYKAKAIFITHLHPDHAFFILEKRPIEIDATVYAPELNENVSAINVVSGNIDLDPYSITPIPTHHSKLVKSTAYLVARGGQKLLYTGDIIWINKEYHHLLHGLDLVITDGSHMRKGGLVRRDKETGVLYGHTGIPDLVNLFREFTANILFVHFGAWFYRGVEASRTQLEELGRTSGVKLVVGYDGLELDLDDLN
jgi:ribonuclease BN (tRNA processing enzyme)